TAAPTRYSQARTGWGILSFIASPSLLRHGQTDLTEHIRNGALGGSLHNAIRDLTGRPVLLGHLVVHPLSVPPGNPLHVGVLGTVRLAGSDYGALRPVTVDPVIAPALRVTRLDGVEPEPD